ncbi:uncharacterized protein LTR77_001530 [Saxophila tyrrhenica]|uniref:Uncharacterized protein n=1 Tax=Saxophila tyrrhenica TaxID=1690608 RepID=A0AAV9PL20_9PEZI|nr:hypothetical protein LTR77_001530 [Saxophila tyrrhenica]
MHISLFSLLALAATLPTHAQPLTSSRTLTAASILKIAPSTRTCASPPAPGECRTASQAAPYLALSFQNYYLPSFATQAALLALILYESANFQYAKNHFPGVPGQGTRNMQSPEYNLKYATWLATVCQNCGIGMEEVEQAEQEGPEAVLGTVNGDMWGFGSAAWFLATQCGEDVRRGLEQGTEEGWEGYLTGCVGTTVTEERTAVWRKVMALKGW